MTIPALTFNPILSISVTGPTFAILDSVAVINDGGNILGAIRITLGPGEGSLGVVVGGVLTTTGTIGTIAYLYESQKRLLSLISATATGADFTQVLRLVAFGRGFVSSGISQNITVNLGNPIYFAGTGHYFEFVSASTSWDNAKNAASAKTLFGLTGYLATVTTAAEATFLSEKFSAGGLIGGSSIGTAAGTTGANRTWRWETGPETGTIFWNAGAAISGQYNNWASGWPSNSGQATSTTNLEPYVYFGNTDWYDTSSNQSYFVEYSTVSGAGDDGLGGTRSAFSITVQTADGIAFEALTQATKAIEAYLINGVVTSTIGVPTGSVTIGASNATHIQVSIDLGVNTGGKRRQAQGFRIVGGSERELIATRTRVGEVYNFVFLKTVDGSSSVNLLLK